MITLNLRYLRNATVIADKLEALGYCVFTVDEQNKEHEQRPDLYGAHDWETSAELSALVRSSLV